MSIKNALYVLLLLIFCGSVWLNFFLLFGDGITVNNTYNQQQYQNQQQGQVVVGMFAGKGKLSRELYTIDEIKAKGIAADKPYKMINKFLNTLSPEQSLFAIVFYQDRAVSVPVVYDEDK